MRKQTDWSYFEYDVGRYLPYEWDSEENKKNFKHYKPETKKLVWYVFNEENGDIVPINLFEYNWVFLKEGLLKAKKLYKDDFMKFANHVRNWLQHEYWSRSEYETIITSWPPYVDNNEIDRLNKERDESISNYGRFYREHVNLSTGFKIDIYTQVMLNWDRFIEYVWNNKHLITAKKLGIEGL